MDYNTQRPKLRLPEFGRNIQQMVEECMRIKDRNERNDCARTIVSILSRLFPEDIGPQGPDNHKAWDVLQVISDFKLDVDYPFGVLTPDSVNTTPDILPYTFSPMRMRHYGRNIQSLIEVVADMPPGSDRDQSIYKLAMHMKKLLMLHNKEAAEDNIVLRDLEIYSFGRISLNSDTYHLRDIMLEDNSATTKKDKKKKKK